MYFLKSALLDIFISFKSSNSSDNNVEVNFNIHVISTTGEAAKTTNTGPMLTITSTAGEPTATNNSNVVMTNAQQSAMSNMFKQFFK